MTNAIQNGESWWLNFDANVGKAQARMRLETPSAPVLNYLDEVERAEQREAMGLPRFRASRTPTPTPSSIR